RATVRARSFPGREFLGKINVIYPQINKETRTARVRVELSNPQLLLIHDMYVDAEIDTGGPEAVLAVPESAVMDTGSRQAVLVDFGTTFAAAAGLYALAHLPLDAIPDLSDTQVIVYTEYPGQAPQVIEDQVTYPLTTAMLTVPRSKVVRGFSFFGVSFVYVIFEDGTDIYWARSRVLEFLNAATSRIPAGVTPTMGPDATGVGWVY